MKDWLREHASALFIAFEFAMALSLFLGGLYFAETYASATSQREILLRALGIILINLSGVFVAAATATLFFGFDDVRRNLAASLARMFSEADVVELLGPHIKARLRLKLAADMVHDTASGVNASLYKHLEELRVGALSTPYASNTNFSYTITESDLPGFRRGHLTMTYRLHTEHLRGAAQYPVRFYREVVAPKDVFRGNEWLERANIVVGNLSFGHEHVTFTAEEQRPGIIKHTATLEKMVDLSGPETDVVIDVTTLSSDSDPSACFVSRYATSGFSATVVRDSSHVYTAYWYRYCTPERQSPAGGYMTSHPNGISIHTNDWVLPGEGVAVIVVPGKDFALDNALARAHHDAANVSAAHSGHVAPAS